MSRRLQENLVAGVVLLVFIAVIVAAMGYGPRARMVPIPIAALGAVLIIGQIVLQNWKSPEDLHIDLLELIARKATGDDEGLPKDMKEGLDAAMGDSAVAAGPEPAAPRRTFLREIGAAGVVVLLIGMFFVIGPIPTMFVFTCGYFVLSGHYGIVRAVAFSFVFTVLVYALFHLWLGIDMRQGLLDINFGLW
jgi:hypothetical protein